jgi:hypothetical protein
MRFIGKVWIFSCIGMLLFSAFLSLEARSAGNLDLATYNLLVMYFWGYVLLRNK